MAGLRNEEVKALCAAVVAAYSYEDLEQLLQFECGKRLEHLVEKTATFEYAVFKVVIKAIDQGWVVTFINAVLAGRPGNAELKAWQEMNTAAATAPQPRGIPELVLQMDSTHFDLAETRAVIREALLATPGHVIGFGVSYPESEFLNRLIDWLRFHLGDETQSKNPLNLSPVVAPLEQWLGMVLSYRDDLDSANVVCPVGVWSAGAEIIEGFWQGVREQFAGVSRRLVIVFVGDSATAFPQGITVLPHPRFHRQDVAQWAENLVWQRGWPPSFAHRWTEFLCGKAAVGDGHLDVRRLYEAMDKSISCFRSGPDVFQAMLERGK